jgi:cytochrome d ubiquinol oxidase subunit II
LCLGYALLGACWLVKKCEGDVRTTAYRLTPYLAVGLLIFLIVVFVYSLAENLQVIGRWMERPYLFVFPITAALAAVVLAVSVRYRRDDLPFPMVVVIFVSALGTLAISFWPYMIPFVLTINEAAAPPSSLAFMFWGGIFVFPLIFCPPSSAIPSFEARCRRRRISIDIHAGLKGATHERRASTQGDCGSLANPSRSQRRRWLRR